MHQVYDSTNFRAMFGGPNANYDLLGDLGNFAYGRKEYPPAAISAV